MTNTIAYYEHSAMGVKSLMTLGPGANNIRLFFFSTDEKAKVFVPGGLSSLLYNMKVFIAGSGPYL